MIPMNNPLFQLIGAARSGKNPIDFLTQMSGGNPMMMQWLNMVRGKSPAELQKIAQNMAAQRGMSADDIAHQMGLK